MNDLDRRRFVVYDDLDGGFTRCAVLVYHGQLQRVKAVQRGSIPLLEKTIVHAVAMIAANLGPLGWIKPLAKRQPVSIEIVKARIADDGNDAVNGRI